jgi:hypothetical protein
MANRIRSSSSGNFGFAQVLNYFQTLTPDAGLQLYEALGSNLQMIWKGNSIGGAVPTIGTGMHANVATMPKATRTRRRASGRRNRARTVNAGNNQGTGVVAKTG